jgi:hypothetical protein
MKKSKITKKILKDEPIILPEVHHDRSYINYASDENFSFGEPKEFKSSPVASKFSFDLFKEEDAVATPVIRVKHIRSSDKVERWRIFNNNKNIFTLDSTKISKKEKEFLQSVEGVQFLLSYSKSDSLTISGLKKEMKAKLNKKLSVKSKKSSV